MSWQELVYSEERKPSYSCFLVSAGPRWWWLLFTCGPCQLKDTPGCVRKYRMSICVLEMVRSCITSNSGLQHSPLPFPFPFHPFSSSQLSYKYFNCAHHFIGVQFLGHNTSHAVSSGDTAAAPAASIHTPDFMVMVSKYFACP